MCVCVCEKMFQFMQFSVVWTETVYFTTYIREREREREKEREKGRRITL